MQHLFLKGAVTVLLLLLVTSLAGGADNGIPLSPAGVPNGPSVPNLINFQGWLTDASGNPVADGSHTVNYTIWDLPSGGFTLWTENTSQTTSGGLFTHQLGSTTALPEELFQTYDSLYLQVQADGQTILPRIRLTSTPYTRVSNNLETNNTFNPGALGFETYPWGRFSSYGDDGQEQIRLWGNAWGEIFLFDADVSNDRTVVLTANPSSGGELRLGNNAGTTTINLHGGLTGDASAVLPAGAVNATEMSNEPGIAHSFNYGGVTLTTTTTAYDTVTITVPTAGYMVVTANAFFYFNSHTSGSTDYGRAYINTVAGLGDFDNFAIESIESAIASYSGDMGYRSISLTKVHSITAGTYTYYLNADRIGPGTVSLERRHLTAQFFPTAYGSVDNTIASSSSLNQSTSVAGIGLPSQVETITVQEHNARLEAEVAKVKAELEARLQKIEQQLNKNKQAGVEE